MEFIKKNGTLLFLLFFAAFCVFLSLGHYSNIYLDTGREMYYPLAILEGKVLYKDLFCIYGPTAYLFNALLYKISGARLGSLYFAGGASAILIVFLTFIISKKFLKTPYSFAISFFVAITGCLATRIFNFTLPYSYAILYGLVCFLGSVYFLISFTESKKETEILLSAALCGLAASLKYDFVLSLIPFFVVLFKTKNLKLIFKGTFALCLAFLIPFLVLFIQGCSFCDFKEAVLAIKSFSSTEALKIFYSTQGVYYSPRLWGNWVLLLKNFFICFFVVYFGFFIFEKNKFFGVAVVLMGAALAFFGAEETSYLPLTFVVFLFFVFGFKKNSFAENVFILSALLYGAKSFWGLSHVNYGLYFLPVILISFFILISNRFSKRVLNSFAVLLFSGALAFFVADLHNLSFQITEIKTDKGRLETSKGLGEMTNEILNFINKIEEKNPYIAVFPEGLNINFLSGKKNRAPLMYNSLIPLYTEGFGEDKIIEYYKNDPPEYIIFYDLPMTSYGKGAICKTYAYEFCSYVEQNYDFVFLGKNFNVYKERRKNDI